MKQYENIIVRSSAIGQAAQYARTVGNDGWQLMGVSESKSGDYIMAFSKEICDTTPEEAKDSEAPQ